MQAFASNVLEDILSGSRRFIHPLELDRYVRHCSQRRDTIYVMEYESVLVGLGYDRMDGSWVRLFHSVKQLGVKVHVLANSSADDIIANGGENLFHQIHQCADDESKAGIVNVIRNSNPNATIVCVGTEFVSMTLSLSHNDFVYHVHSIGLPRWRSVHDDTRDRFALSAPITIHRLYVFYLMAVAYFFISTAALGREDWTASENAGEGSPENTDHDI